MLTSSWLVSEDDVNAQKNVSVSLCLHPPLALESSAWVTKITFSMFSLQEELGLQDGPLLQS